MKDKIKTIFNKINQKSKLKIQITLFINIIMLILLITFVSISVNLPETEPIQKFFIYGKIIIELIYGIEFLILTGFIVLYSHRKLKRLAILDKDHDFTHSLWKYPILIIFSFGLANFFLFSSIMNLMIIEYVSRAYYHLTDIFYFVSIPGFISIIVACSYRGIIKNTLLPKWTETGSFRSLIKGRDKISIKELQRNFKGNKKYFYDSLLEWVKQFRFTIEGDMIILNKDTVEDFIRTLDSKYLEWETAEKKKLGKI